MTGCVVKRCLNYSAKHSKSTGVTFHRFPTDPDTCGRWREKIRLSRNDSQWNPTKNSRICSRHFEDKDKFTSKAGLCKLHKNAMPTKDLFVAYILVSQNTVESKNKITKTTKRKLKNEVTGNDMKLDNQVKFEIEVESNEVKSEKEMLLETQVKLEKQVQLELESDLGTETNVKRDITLEIQVKQENVTDDELPQLQEQSSPGRLSSQLSPEEVDLVSTIDTPQKNLNTESLLTKSHCTKHRKIILCLRQKIRRLTKSNKSMKEELKALKHLSNDR